MNARRRRGVLALAAAATLAAAAWVSGQGEQGEAVAQPARAPTPEARRADASARPVPETAPDLRRAPFPEAPADPFAARSWTPQVTAKPPAPTAPALPYTYFGRMTEEGKLFVFLQRGERSYTVTRGDMLDSQYRVDDITPTAVVIMYLPLMQRQVLHTGS